jgi:hypothetical protein
MGVPPSDSMTGAWPRKQRLGRSAAVMAVAAFVLSCGESPTGPEAVLTVRVESERGIYYHAPGDRVEIEIQEAYYAWLIDRTGLEPTQRFVFFKYRDRDHLLAVTGSSGNAWAEGGNYRFHTIWPTDDHESVHALVTARVGDAPPLLSEGFAVAHQTLPSLDVPRWSGTLIDVLAARYQEQHAIPALDSLLENGDFRRYDSQMTYPVAGSFVKSLLDRHGYDPVLQLFRASDPRASASELRSAFREAFAEEIEAAWDTWLAQLDG